MKTEATCTRRLYAFETGPLGLNTEFHYLNAQRPMAMLQRMAGRVWADERLLTPCPRVTAGRGTPGASALLSYYEPNLREICLSRHQRDYGVLLHELAHAMGGRDKIVHGPTFAARVLYLYAQYGRVPTPYLLIWAEQYKLI